MEKKSKISKKDFLDLMTTLDKLGDVVIEIGNFEKSFGSIGNLEDIFNKNLNEIVTHFDKNPKLASNIGKILVTFLSLTSTLKKRFSQLSPEDKLKAGNAIKEISVLLKEITDNL